MNPTPTLSGAHRRTYDTIFQHPVSHNLKWHDVRTLLDHLGDMTMEPNGNLKVTRHGEILVLHPHRTKDVAETRELMDIRHFLERSDKAAPVAESAAPDWLVVVNHHEALIYRTEVQGSVPQVIRPHEPAEQARQAHEARDYFSGKEKPAPSGFFEQIAQALKDAGEILVFGTGTGASSEMDNFITWLKQHHAELAQRIKGTVAIDESHLTEPQLLAKARELYARPPLAAK
jgi:hypothetical protein